MVTVDNMADGILTSSVDIFIYKKKLGRYCALSVNVWWQKLICSVVQNKRILKF